MRLAADVLPEEAETPEAAPIVIGARPAKL